MARFFSSLNTLGYLQFSSRNGLKNHTVAVPFLFSWILHFNLPPTLVHLADPWLRAAMRELPKYKKGGQHGEDSAVAEEDEEKKELSEEFGAKTDQLLDYIEKTYLQGVLESDAQGKNIIEKMRLDNSQKVRLLRVLT